MWNLVITLALIFFAFIGVILFLKWCWDLISWKFNEYIKQKAAIPTTTKDKEDEEEEEEEQQQPKKTNVRHRRVNSSKRD
jgi:hypothetical protein